MSTHNLCFEQKYEIHQSFSSENFQVLEEKKSIYLNRSVFVMIMASMRKRFFRQKQTAKAQIRLYIHTV